MHITLEITITNNSEGEYTARCGNYTGAGNTPEASMDNLVQRIKGLPVADRNQLWATGQTKAKGSGTGD